MLSLRKWTCHGGGSYYQNRKQKNSVPSLSPAVSQVGPESRRSSRLEGAPRWGRPPPLAGWGLPTDQWTWMRTQSRLLREARSPGTEGDGLNWGTRYERGKISQNHSSSSLPDDQGNPWDKEAIQWRDKLVNPTFGSHLTSNLHWISPTSSLPSSHPYLSLMWLRWEGNCSCLPSKNFITYTILAWALELVTKAKKSSPSMAGMSSR